MRDWPIGTSRAVAAVLAGFCLCLAGAAPAPAPAAPTTRPARHAAAAAAPVPQAATKVLERSDTQAPAQPPATAPAPVTSKVGQSLIRGPAGAAPATRPASSGGDSSAGPAAQPAAPTLEFSKVAGALAIVLTLIFALRLVMKRAFGVAGAVGSSRSVVVLSRTVLAPKQQVMLVHVGRRVIVVGDSGGQMSTLSEITDPDEVAALVGQLRDEKLSSAAPAFGGLLGRLRGGMEAGDFSTDTNASTAARIPQQDDGPRDAEDPGDDPETGPTRQEISGLLAKVRMLSHQFKGT